jgi:hypothetical protein
LIILIFCGIRIAKSILLRLGTSTIGGWWRWTVELLECRPGRRGDVGEPVQQLVEAAAPSSTAACSSSVSGSSPASSAVLPGFEELDLAGVLRGVEVALGAGYAGRALLKERLLSTDLRKPEGEIPSGYPTV